MKALHDVGQSFWLDSISREMISGGDLKRLVNLYGLRGVTSNPAIFQKAISGGSAYDAQIVKAAKAGKSVFEIYEALVVEDIRKAADVLAGVYKSSKGEDGYVSLEVSPALAHDTAGTVEEARRLWAAVGRPNLMIKVPATRAGLGAITTLTAEGINVNVTLIFSLEVHEDVMSAYLKGLEARQAKGGKLNHIASVASFFLSRIDKLVDGQLAARVGVGSGDAQRLMGRVAIASAKVAYQNFLTVKNSDRFKKLSKAGARMQRPLWASTSTKNALYPAWKYVEPLVGPDTVNTMPPETVAAFLARDIMPGANSSIAQDVEDARLVLKTLKKVGIDLNAAVTQLQEQGVAKFQKPFDKLLAAIAEKRAETTGVGSSQSEAWGTAEDVVEEMQKSAQTARLVQRLWSKDSTLWTNEKADGSVFKSISNRLGWLDVADQMLECVPEITSFAREIRKAGFKHVVLLGMGGSSLCPEVCATTFGQQEGWPVLLVLDSTSPDAVAALERKIDLRRSLFVPASKSGSTIETNCFFQYFYERLDAVGVSNPGQHFVAITDPGSPFIEVAEEHGFRRVFLNPPDIGGRYSALSLFGLLPMALMGLDVRKVLNRAREISQAGAKVASLQAHEAVRLGVALGAMEREGRDKLTFIISPGVSAFGFWVEQLIAESTGKQGMGIVPVEGERVRRPSDYIGDRVFVGMQLEGDREIEPTLAALEKADFPVIRIHLRDAYDLGREFLRWETATAAAGMVMDINPFDEPNVSESKQNTGDILAEAKKASGRLPMPKSDLEEAGIKITFSDAVKPGKNSKAKAARLLQSILQETQANDYVALLGFLAPTSRVMSAMATIRASAGRISECATTAGIGPRYLHSTGQLHKGGADNGVFIMFMADTSADVAIPGEEFDFATLFHAQALGDFRSLNQHGRRAVLIHLGSNVEKGLKTVAGWLGK
jgi:transaldolase/glucose-6-phosphate isomerase